MITWKLTEETFLEDVSSHQMTILLDTDTHRHIRFKKPGSTDQFFDLITWPGALCYTGDMGTYVFRRLTDMFEFFRTDANSHWLASKGLTLGINKSYWSEKLESSDRCDGYKQFSPDKFKAVICEQRLEWIRERSINKDLRRELWEAIDTDILWYADDNEYVATNAANQFHFVLENKPFEFTDFGEHNLEDYTLRFTWCCYALAWGIQQYDKAKTKP